MKIKFLRGTGLLLIVLSLSLAAYDVQGGDECKLSNQALELDISTTPLSISEPEVPQQENRNIIVIIGAIIVAGYEVTVRLVRTNKTFSIWTRINAIITWVIPDRRKQRCSNHLKH